MDGKEVIRRLKAAGYEVVGVNGSHHMLRKPGKPKIPVPVHGAKDLKIGTLKNIERLSGVKLGK